MAARDREEERRRLETFPLFPPDQVAIASRDDIESAYLGDTVVVDAIVRGMFMKAITDRPEDPTERAAFMEKLVEDTAGIFLGESDGYDKVVKWNISDDEIEGNAGLPGFLRRWHGLKGKSRDVVENYLSWKMIEFFNVLCIEDVDGEGWIDLDEQKKLSIDTLIADVVGRLMGVPG